MDNICLLIEFDGRKISSIQCENLTAAQKIMQERFDNYIKKYPAGDDNDLTYIDDLDARICCNSMIFAWKIETL